MRSGIGLIAGAVRVVDVAPARQPEDQCLEHVLDHRKAAGHVAVQRAVAGGHLALVAGGQHDAAELVGQRHQQHAADAGLDVLLGRVLRQPLELLASDALNASNSGLDGDLVVAHAQARGHVARVDPGNVGRVGRRHHHRAHLVACRARPPRRPAPAPSRCRPTGPAARRESRSFRCSRARPAPARPTVPPRGCARAPWGR